MQNFTFDIAKLTLGQTEFITDYAGMSLAELQQAFEDGIFGARELIAVLAIAKNPEDPAAALAEVKALPLIDMGDVEVVFTED